MGKRSNHIGIWLYPLMFMGAIFTILAVAQNVIGWEELRAAVNPIPPPEMEMPAIEVAEPVFDPEQSSLFVWRPTGSDDETLLVTLPRELVGRIASCSVEIAGLGEKIPMEEGRFSGTMPDGRPRYAFGRAGSHFPGPSFVKVSLRNGKEISWRIQKTESTYKEMKPLDASYGADEARPR